MLSYKEIDEYVINPKKMPDLLEVYFKIFNAIDNISDMMTEGVYEVGEQIKFAIIKLAGYQGKLRLVVVALQTEEKKRQLKVYKKLKNAIMPGEKFISDAAKKEAAESVSDYRKVCGIFEAYLETCETHINSCQSVLSYTKEELKIAKG